MFFEQFSKFYNIHFTSSGLYSILDMPTIKLRNLRQKNSNSKSKKKINIFKFSCKSTRFPRKITN